MSILAKLRALAAPNFVPPSGAEKVTGEPLVPSGTAASIVAPNLQTKQRRSVKEKLMRGSVEWSPDLARVVALPRRPKPDLKAIAEELTARLKKPHGRQTLREIQAWGLWEAPQVNGLIAQIAVGGGKSLMGLLMPMVMPSCKRAVLFVPPDLRAQLQKDIVDYGEHWVLPNIAGGDNFVVGRPVLHIVAYSELSQPKSSDLLTKQLKPDLIIADEVHSLKGRGTARVRRFLRFAADASDEVRFCGWSGTLTSRSLLDYAHLAAVALDNSSPLPLHAPTVEEWASALDPDDLRGGYFDAGKLKTSFCNPGESVREGFRRRLTDTRGFVATAENQLGVSLNFFQRKPPPVPDKVQEHLRKLRKSPTEGGWVRPDGEELVDALRVAACARELAMGCFYRWRFPKGEPEDLIMRWFNARQAWNKEIRTRLHHSMEHLDSPMLCANAARRFYASGCVGCDREAKAPHKKDCKEKETHPLWGALHWPTWSQLEDSVYHETEVVWVDDYLLKDAAAWLKEKPGIAWTEHVEFGEKLAKLAGVPYYGGGDDASANIIHEDGKRSIVASTKAHHKGKNLQVFNRNLVVAPPGDGATLEQLIGRTHREGQKADEVEVYFYTHTPELNDALDKAIERAKYIAETTGSAQKLVYGTWSF